MNCPTCNSQLYDRGSTHTLVNYSNAYFTDEKGHHCHDDNCVVRTYQCANGHYVTERRQNTCPACDWKGKTDCFCHPLGVKVHDQKENI